MAAKVISLPWSSTLEVHWTTQQLQRVILQAVSSIFLHFGITLEMLLQMSHLTLMFDCCVLLLTTATACACRPPQGILEDPELHTHREHLLSLLLLTRMDTPTKRLLQQDGWMGQLTQHALPSLDVRQTTLLMGIISDIHPAVSATPAFRVAEVRLGSTSQLVNNSSRPAHRVAGGSRGSSSSSRGRGSGDCSSHGRAAGRMVQPGSNESASVANGSARPASAASCIACGATGSLLRCGRCRTAYFCDAACQKRAWPSHKQDCQKLRGE